MVHVERTNEVYVNEPRPVVGVCFEKWYKKIPAGVVDKNVSRAEFCSHLL